VPPSILQLSSWVLFVEGLTKKEDAAMTISFRGPPISEAVRHDGGKAISPLRSKRGCD
jgi:hypothetical protein